jgi:hypothetical protein
MAMRLINHILHFSKSEKKRVVPLALALLSLSNAKINVMDLLYKLAYDTDTEISYRAIICLGLVGAGTNNSRLADILRKLASYYSKESDPLLLVRLAQGLLYMGKGMLSIQPYYSERFLVSKVGMAGLVTFLVSLLDINATILGKYHYFIYFLTLSMYPKFLFVVTLTLFSSTTGSNPCPSTSESARPLTLSDRPESPRKLQAFRRILPLFSSETENGPSWQRKSSSRSRTASWRTSSFCGRTRITWRMSVPARRPVCDHEI